MPTENLPKAPLLTQRFFVTRVKYEKGSCEDKSHVLGMFDNEEDAHNYVCADIQDTISESAWSLVENMDKMNAWDCKHENGYEWNIEKMIMRLSIHSTLQKEN